MDATCLVFGDFNEDEFSKYFQPDKAVKFLTERRKHEEVTIGICDEKRNIERCSQVKCSKVPNDIQIQKIYDVNEEISSGVESLNGAELNENNEEDSTGNSDSSVNNYVEKEDILQVTENHKEQLDDLKPSVVETAESKPVKQTPSTWAALFKSTLPPQSSKAPIIVSVQVEQSAKEERKLAADSNDEGPVTSVQKDKKARALADFLQNANLSLGNTALQLRGLINNGNWCYINATLQSLLGCSAFYRLFKSLSPFKHKCGNASSLPLTDTMIEFVNQFSTLDHKAFYHKGKKTDDLRLGASFEPKQVYEILSVLKTTLSETGKQQDAEEFLTFLLNGLHEEFVSLNSLVPNLAKNNVKHQDDKLVNGAVYNPSSVVVDSDGCRESGQDVSTDDWEQVGRNNKSAMLRKTSDNETLITKLFGGVVRSSVQHAGAKESASLQPFFTIQLDIQAENIWNIKDAFENYFTKENLEGFTSSKTNSEVEASHKTSLEKLPRILILHLKYFIYDKTGGCQKTHKAIEITRELEIPTDVLSPILKGRVPANHRTYELFAIEFHHGKNSAGGHYTTAVKHKEPLGWVYCNDNVIQRTQFNQIFKHHKEKVPYLLFYERSTSK